MAGGEHKPVAIEPFWRIGIEAHCLAPEDSADFCRSEGKAEVSRAALVDGVDREPAGFIGSFGEGVWIRHFGRF